MELDRMLQGLQAGPLDVLKNLPLLKVHVEAHDLDRETFGRVLAALGPPIKDLNFKVAIAALDVLASLVLSEHHVKQHLNAITNQVIDKLGDMKQSVRHAASDLLLTLTQLHSLRAFLDRAQPSWEHRSYRVREGVVTLVTAHISATGALDLTPREVEHTLLPRVVGRLEDSQAEVRSAAVDCLAAMYAILGEGLAHMLTQHTIRAAQMKDLQARFDRLAPLAAAAAAASSAVPRGSAGSECAAPPHPAPAVALPL